MREWVAIQQLFSPGRTCLNYPNEAEWLWLSWKGIGRQGTQQSHAGEAGGARASTRVCLCEGEHALYGCPVKLNGACRVPNEPVLAGRLTHSNLPLCASLFHLCCRGRVVNPSLPWTLAFTKPIHIFNKGQALRMQTSQWVSLHLFLPCLVK